MEYTYQKTVTVTVKDIYGMDNPSIPDGWESTGELRPPKKDDWFLTTLTPHPLQADPGWTDSDPRIILRKKKIKRIIYTQVRTGTPQPGEFYQSANMKGEQMYKLMADCVDEAFMKNNYPNVPIFKREEEEV